MKRDLVENLFWSCGMKSAHSLLAGPTSGEGCNLKIKIHPHPKLKSDDISQQKQLCCQRLMILCSYGSIKTSQRTSGKCWERPSMDKLSSRLDFTESPAEPTHLGPWLIIKTSQATNENGH